MSTDPLLAAAAAQPQAAAFRFFVDVAAVAVDCIDDMALLGDLADLDVAKPDVAKPPRCRRRPPVPRREAKPPRPPHR